MLFQCLCGFELVCHFTQADDEPVKSRLILPTILIGLGYMLFVFGSIIFSNLEKGSPTDYASRIKNATLLEGSDELKTAPDGTYILYGMISSDEYLIDDYGRQVIYAMQDRRTRNGHSTTRIFASEKCYLDDIPIENVAKFENTLFVYLHKDYGYGTYSGILDYYDGTFLVDRAGGTLRDVVFFANATPERVIEYRSDPDAIDDALSDTIGILSAVFGPLFIFFVVLTIAEVKKNRRDEAEGKIGGNDAPVSYKSAGQPAAATATKNAATATQKPEPSVQYTAPAPRASTATAASVPKICTVCGTNMKKRTICPNCGWNYGIALEDSPHTDNSPYIPTGTKPAKLQSADKTNKGQKLVGVIVIIAICMITAGSIMGSLSDKHVYTDEPAFTKDNIIADINIDSDNPYQFVDMVGYDLADGEFTEHVEYNLMSGYYIVGIHIPEGIYCAEASNPYDVIFVEDNVHDIFLYEYAAKEGNHMSDLRLFNGALVQIKSDVGIKLVSDCGWKNAMRGRSNPLTESYTFSGKTEYIAGLDFAPGVYDITYDVTADTIPLEITDEYGEVIRVKDVAELADYLPHFENLILPEGAKLSADTATSIILIPSEKIWSTYYLGFYKKYY